MTTDLKSVIVTDQERNKVLNSILAALNKGLLVDPIPAVYTVATLPTTAANGQFAFASNARKPGEGAGVGTGLPAFFDSATSTWLSYAGTALTV